jgi:hypothetical protein
MPLVARARSRLPSLTRAGKGLVRWRGGAASETPEVRDLSARRGADGSSPTLEPYPTYTAELRP